MKLGSILQPMAVATVFAVISFAAPLGDVVQHIDSLGSSSGHVLGKRDAYTCFGRNATATAVDCQAVLGQLQQLGDKEFSLYSGVCLNWARGTCNFRFCAEPWVVSRVNRTASWMAGYANDYLMNCISDGQYAVMGDNLNLNSNGGTYRLWIEEAVPEHTYI
ncbi:hypothetical protein F5Y18DRAFT_410073 [Xylariaceae sp. FL1019]|nr:hypothetical protein F5Y18DRAFT_410073 [Xylariaceae sp. FL1019]